MSPFTVRLLLTGLWSAICINGASAEKPFADSEPRPAAWVSAKPLHYTYDGWDIGNAPDFSGINLSIHSTSTNQHPVILTCMMTSYRRYEMTAAIQLHTGDPTHRDIKQPGLVAARYGRFYIDGETFLVPITVRRRSNLAFIGHRPINIPAKLYNAVLRGTGVSLKIAKNTYALSLPERDSVFTEFAKTCPVTNGGNLEPWDAFVATLDSANE